ncbi:MAG: DUF1453 family protein [Caulobacterales bacterium]|nr:DUF1453 family protein [Caulobacterales bacterium]
MDFRDPKTVGPIIGIVIFLAIFSLRMMRSRQQRPLKLEWLWVTPAVLILMSGFLLWQFRPQGLEWLRLAVIFAIGGAIGWQRGRMMTITVDPATHDLNQQASPAAMILLVGLVAIRLGLRSVLTEEAGALHITVNFITDAFVILGVGLLGVTRLEMFLRARKLLSQARAA